MKVVCNASPLINLARVSKLDLLRQLYGELHIPKAVWHEVVEKGVGQAGADQVQTTLWIKTQVIANLPLARALQQDLDVGEAEAIVLALETGADLLIMDERLGRETAHHLGLRYIGLIGVLIAAKRRGLIREIKPHLDSLRDVAGFRVDEALYRRVLKDEKED
jgi:predicted nucleic acid-binding protein